MDLETGKSVDKYLFYIFSVFVHLSIMDIPYVVGRPAGGHKTLNGPP